MWTRPSRYPLTLQPSFLVCSSLFYYPSFAYLPTSSISILSRSPPLPCFYNSSQLLFLPWEATNPHLLPVPPSTSSLWLPYIIFTTSLLIPFPLFPLPPQIVGPPPLPLPPPSPSAPRVVGATTSSTIAAPPPDCHLTSCLTDSRWGRVG